VKKVQFRVGSGERKILIVLVYYAFLNVFALMAFSLALRNGDQYQLAVRWNFICESVGYNPASPCDRSQVDGLKFPEINIVAYVLLVSIPNVNLIFVINWRKLKDWFCVHVVRDKRHIYARSQSSVSNNRFYSASVSYQTSSAEFKLRSQSAVSMVKTNTPLEFNLNNIHGTETTPNDGIVRTEEGAKEVREEDISDNRRNSNGMLTQTNGSAPNAVKSPLEENTDLSSRMSPSGDLYHLSSAV